jgi:hypothetical protein
MSPNSSRNYSTSQLYLALGKNGSESFPLFSHTIKNVSSIWSNYSPVLWFLHLQFLILLFPFSFLIIAHGKGRFLFKAFFCHLPAFKSAMDLVSNLQSDLSLSL